MTFAERLAARMYVLKPVRVSVPTLLGSAGVVTMDRVKSWEECSEEERAPWIAYARLSLGDLREPTDEMVEAGNALMLPDDSSATCHHAWQAMIDVARLKANYEGGET